MPKFYVRIPITGSIGFEVEAENARAAKDAAWDVYNDKGPDAGDVTWEAVSAVTTGNVFRGELNNIEVSEA